MKMNIYFKGDMPCTVIMYTDGPVPKPFTRANMFVVMLMHITDFTSIHSKYCCFNLSTDVFNHVITNCIVDVISNLFLSSMALFNPFTSAKSLA